ncbi:MAG: RagB/SusD family nutrient uptake outer membrane protein [Bacteroidota bacterium]
MKSKLYILLTSLFLVISVSCDDGFLEIIPDNDITVEELLDSPEKAQEYLNASYKTLAATNVMGGQTWFLSDLMSDNVDGSTAALTSGDWRAHYTWTTDIFLGTTRSLMSGAGLVNGTSNYLMANLDLVPGLNEGDRSRMEAEARFLRGLAHFELVRLFAQPYGFTADNSHQGIAIQLAYTTVGSGQNTVAEVYDQVVADMESAANALPTENNGYATSWSAKAYLARVYFQMHDYQKAFEMANDVINNGGFAFDPDLMNRFSMGGTTESTLNVLSEFITDVEGGDTSFFLLTHSAALQDQYRVAPNGLAPSYISPEAAIAANGAGVSNPLDLRSAWFSQTETGLWTSSKFGLNDPFVQIPLVHITELKLIRAEAAAELGSNLDVAIQDLNDIKLRADVPTLSDGASDLAIIQEARRERRIEMIGEGNRLHELKRIGAATRQGLTKLADEVKVRGAAWDCPGLVCQFPEIELVGSPELQPNPSGDCQ